MLRGPEGTVYADGVFHIKIKIPERFVRSLSNYGFCYLILGTMFTDNCGR